ncbi:MAG: glycosyltransferase [Flavobacteriales bacterium]
MTNAGVPKVSILVPTYQHKEYIAACLEGILMQRTNFPFEVLVGEDESSDGTREICQRYAAAHSDRIRLFLRSRKDVLHIMGRPTGRANLLDLIKESKGSLIALCEGDDVWVDPEKLQCQVDALANDPTATGCFTNVLNDRLGVRSPYFEVGVTLEPPSRATQKDLLLSFGLPTCSFLFVRDELMPLPPELWKAPVADSLLFAHVSRNGHFIYLPRYTAVRHMHPGGLNSMRTKAHKFRVNLRTLPFIDSITKGKYHKELLERRRKDALFFWSEAIRTNDGDLARLCWSVLRRERALVGWSMTTMWRNYLKAWWPRTERAIFSLLEA